MPRKRRNPKTRRAEIPADMVDFLSDRETSNPWVFFTDDAEFLAAWNELRDEILAEWIVTAPGTRPSFWWKSDAPRQQIGTFEGCYYDGKLPEPRRRLGGIGTEGHEVFNIVPHYISGIPTDFVDRWAERKAAVASPPQKDSTIDAAYMPIRPYSGNAAAPA